MYSSQKCCHNSKNVCIHLLFRYKYKVKIFWLSVCQNILHSFSFFCFLFCIIQFAAWLSPKLSNIKKYLTSRQNYQNQWSPFESDSVQKLVFNTWFLNTYGVKILFTQPRTYNKNWKENTGFVMHIIEISEVLLLLILCNNCVKTFYRYSCSYSLCLC